MHGNSKSVANGQLMSSLRQFIDFHINSPNQQLIMTNLNTNFDNEAIFENIFLCFWRHHMTFAMHVTTNFNHNDTKEQIFFLFQKI